MAWDANWDTKGKWKQYPKEAFIGFVARNFYSVPKRNELSMLEVGYGSGANLWFLAREGFRVYGVEGSPTAAAAARARLDEECPGWVGELHVGDMESLPFADNFFDLVVDRGAIFYNPYENSLRMYQELLRVAKPGALLYSDMLNTDSYGYGMGEKVGRNAWIGEDNLYVRYTDMAEIPELLKGWDDIVVDIDSWSVGGVKNGRVYAMWVATARKPKQG